MSWSTTASMERYRAVKYPRRRDVEAFVENIRTGRSTPLLNVTSGYHFHHVAADQEEILDEIEAALREKGFLADFLSYEQEEVEK